MKIHNKNSAEMTEIQDGEVQLIVTSPPYPMIERWDRHFGTRDFEEQHQQLLQTWKECYRILDEGGILCINIGDATRSINGNFVCYPNYAKVVSLCMELGLHPLIPILWKKIQNRHTAYLGSGFHPPNLIISQDTEHIAVFRKGHCRQIKTTEPKRAAAHISREERDLWCSQLWEIPGARGAGVTASFPPEIPYRLISLFSIVGDLVVDPFSGSHTTGIVAERLQRRFVGYEIAGEKQLRTLDLIDRKELSAASNPPAIIYKSFEEMLQKDA